MTPEILSSVTAVLLSLSMSYIPGIAPWYQALTSEVKSSVMALLLIAVAAGATALACTGFGAELGVQISCDTNGVLVMIRALVAALVANQATYVLSPQRRIG